MYDYTLYALGQLKVSGVTSNAYYVSGHVDLQRIYIVTLASTHRCIYSDCVCYKYSNRSIFLDHRIRTYVFDSG